MPLCFLRPKHSWSLCTSSKTMAYGTLCSYGRVIVETAKEGYVGYKREQFYVVIVGRPIIVPILNRMQVTVKGCVL